MTTTGPGISSVAPRLESLSHRGTRGTQANKFPKSLNEEAEHETSVVLFLPILVFLT